MNYALHTKELGNDLPTQPVVFMKPDTSILKDNQPFYYPSFSSNIHHEVELVIRISKEGKNIEEAFAHKYYDQIALGIDFTARDIQLKLREQGHPWLLCKGFDKAAPISKFLPVSEFDDLQNLDFSLKVNDEEKQSGNTSEMLFTIDKLVSFISTYCTLKQGDLIFTGTPEGVGEVKIGDRLTGFLEGKKMIDFEIL